MPAYRLSLFLLSIGLRVIAVTERSAYLRPALRNMNAFATIRPLCFGPALIMVALVLFGGGV
jgi:hypothetical protein